MFCFFRLFWFIRLWFSCFLSIYLSLQSFALCCSEVWLSIQPQAPLLGWFMFLLSSCWLFWHWIFWHWLACFLSIYFRLQSFAFFCSEVWRSVFFQATMLGWFPLSSWFLWLVFLWRLLRRLLRWLLRWLLRSFTIRVVGLWLFRGTWLREINVHVPQVPKCEEVAALISLVVLIVLFCSLLDHLLKLLDLFLFLFNNMHLSLDKRINEIA